MLFELETNALQLGKRNIITMIEEVVRAMAMHFINAEGLRLSLYFCEGQNFKSLIVIFFQ